ncbi:sigma factor-like helix-turn-helix DNA-binding protein, partial [Rhodococcus gannanensis]
VEAARPYRAASTPMDGLSRSERDVLVLRTAVGLSAAQAGEALGCSVERVRLDQHSALQKLRAAA